MNYQNFIPHILTALGSALPALLFWFINKNKKKVKIEELNTQKTKIHRMLQELDLSNHNNIREEAEKYNQSLFKMLEQDNPAITMDVMERYLRDGNQLLNHLNRVEEEILSKKSSIEGDSTTYKLKLKLKASKEIKHIFNNFPCHLKSQYVIEVQIIDNDEFRSEHSQKRTVLILKRDDFNYLKVHLKSCKPDLMALSKENHCILEFRPPESNTEFQSLTQNVWQPYLVVKGKSGVQMKRENQIFHVRKGEERKIEEKDEIILLPQLSYVVKYIQQINN